MDPVTLALAKSWAEGEFGDLRELGPHIEAILDSRIVEMGSNANGEYVRWEHGLQMCWKNAITLSANTASNRFDATWDYPAQFLSAPHVSHQIESALFNPVSWAGKVFAGLATRTTTSASLRGYVVSGTVSSGETGRTDAFAIGRWK